MVKKSAVYHFKTLFSNFITTVIVCGDGIFIRSFERKTASEASMSFFSIPESRLSESRWLDSMAKS